MTYRTPLSPSTETNLGPTLGIGIFGALLSALAVWLLDGPSWAVIAGYVLGGMLYTVLGSVWLSRVPPQSSD